MPESAPSRSRRVDSEAWGVSGRLVARLRGYERAVWGSMVLGLVLDSVLTYYGLHNGMVEANPLVRTSLETFGNAAGILAPKTVAVSCALVGAAVVAARHRVVIPMALAVPWLLAAGVNFVGLFVV